jgi:hypothetical protein
LGRNELKNGFDIHYFFGIARVSMKEHQEMIAEAFEAYLNLEEETEDA